MVQVAQLRFEHHDSPAVGIGENQPRISWTFSGGDQDWMQESYEIEILRSDKTTEQFNVQSGESCLVPWPGKPLHSRERAEVRVKVIGKSPNSTRSEWSEKAIVESGLLHDEDWHSSHLIEPGDQYQPERPNRPVVFRKSFSVQKAISHARLYATAHGVYEARINDHAVDNTVLAPGWTSYSKRLYYQTYDVTRFLANDKDNTIDMAVGAGWFCGRLGFNGGRRNIYGNRIGLLAMLILTFDDGSTACFCSDESWHWTYGPTIVSELYDGEEYDANMGLSSNTPWYSVTAGTRPTTLVAPMSPPIKRIEELNAVKILTSPSGNTIVDFGQNFVGWVRVKTRGPSGTKITLQHAEVLERGEIVMRTLRQAKATDTIILSGELLEWEPKFTFHGFRYVQVSGWQGELQLEDLKGIVIHTDMERRGQFSCSDSLLNKLHENVVWSMKGNFVGIPTDCPQRDERLGWTGDINVFAETANYLYDTSGMLTSWLVDLSLEQNHGIVPLVVPNFITQLEEEAHAVWGDVAVMLPWALYRSTGDASILSRQYSSMKAWMEAIPRNPDGLWNYSSRWKLADWLDPAAPPDDPGNATTDPDLVSDAFLVHITNLMALTSSVIQETADHSRYVEESRKLKEAFNLEYVTPSGRVAGDTQTALGLAINFSLLSTEAQQQKAADRLSTLIRRNSQFKIATGFAGTPYLGHALTKVGLSSLFYRMLLHQENPSWLYPVTMGATTIWERWDSMLPNGEINPGEMTSFNHYALGAVANWMHSVIVGLKPIEPGWRTFAVEPVPGGGLDWAEGSYKSSYGQCSVRWEIKDSSEGNDKKTLQVSIQVPPNTTAKVTIPGTTVIVTTVGSGKHEWKVPYIAPEWPPQALITDPVEVDD